MNHTRIEIISRPVRSGWDYLPRLSRHPTRQARTVRCHRVTFFSPILPQLPDLKPGDPVEIAGVKVGRVEGMGLAEDKARLTLRLNDGVKLQEDVIASVRARGLIGDKFVLVSPGASDKIIPAGGRIRETDSPPDIPDLIGKIVGGDLTSKGEKKDETPKSK